MKIFSTFLFILIIGFQINISAQIPNSGFENWVGGDPSVPEGWITNNAPPAYTPVTRTTEAYSGSYAVQLYMVYFGANVIPPYMQSTPFPVSEAYGSLNGHYQFFPFMSTEVLFIAAWFSDDGQLVGAGGIDIGTGASSYSSFSFDIAYIPGFVPDTAYIWIGITDTSLNPPSAGGYAYVDELSFGPPSDVHEISSNIPDNFELSQNYPNPFNPSTKIEYSIPEASFVQLKVYDILGNEVATLVNEEQSAGTYRADFSGINLASGLYIAKLQAGDYSQTIKMSLLK